MRKKVEAASSMATGLDGPSGAEEAEAASSMATGLVGPGGAEEAEAASSMATGLDGPSGAEEWVFAAPIDQARAVVWSNQPGQQNTTVLFVRRP